MGEAKRRQKTGQPAAVKRSPGKTPIVLGVVVVLVLIFTVLYYVTRSPAPDSAALPSVPPTAEPFPDQLDQYGVAMGDADAPVVVREFADYQCPACARFASATERLKEEYVETGQVLFVFFDLPLRQHENAVPAAMAARCAADQDAYWGMHDRLFTNQSEWADSNSATEIFTRYAGDLGLDERRFRRCMETDLHREAVEQSRQVAMQLQVTSTPTVLVDNIPLSQPGWGQLSAVVERELAKAE
ncbi:MAG: thioredoxin domain-containing protein [Marinobacter sp.]|uniref:DsbA family protein n=1 Tax=Marinobacter sp. TaxID=50741 RepID=UPI00299ECE51|nr:thioredoxin domain-containing protein [Marinobacter sp.]MDX1634684.1 thioredoxin domain-containing protein [Marinobacter sp.]